MSFRNFKEKCPKYVYMYIPKIEYVEIIKYDSIYIINDSIVEKIKYVEKQYEKESEYIMSADDSTNMSIFTRYIEDYQRTIKNN